jgi:hypothetical protein
MVAGTIALMLQKNGTLTPGQIKASLLNTAVEDTATGSCPNAIWGWGKLDADAAWNDIPTPAGVDEFTAELRDGDAHLRWTVSDEIDYVGWDIYRAATIFGGWVRVNDEMIQADGDTAGFIDDTIEHQEGRFLYRLESIGSNGASELRGTTMIEFGERRPEQVQQDTLMNLTLLED